jgi:rhamnogalacturonan endolyase
MYFFISNLFINMKKNLQNPPRTSQSKSGRVGAKEDPTGSRCLTFLYKRPMAVLFVLLLTVTSLYAQRQMEKLDRGVVAVRTSSSQVFVSWRVLGTDPADIAFNLYRGETRLNDAPITGATNYTDNIITNENYSVRPIINGQEGATSARAEVWTEPFKRLPLKRPAGGTTPDGVNYTYSPNDCSVGDLDGDGEYEIIVKWDPSNSKDNSQAGYTGNVYMDAYKMNGTHLWRIDLGKNIRAGAHYTQFIVYDLDGDGRAEVAMKTADGTVDGAGTVIGNPDVDYRNTSGYILHGPEYLTVFNGQTGAAMATTDYVPARGNVASWGDDYGNRVDRFLAGVGYFDGQRPSLLFTRGYYTRSVLAAWDWRNGQLTQRWVFDSNTEGNSAYAGQGNHNLSISDVDGDGKDEVIFGSMTVDDNGSGLYSTGLGHGDAMHVGDLDPDRPGLESWTAHESPSQYEGNGLWMRDARTGEKLWGVPSTRDVGRAMTADVDPRYKGYEAWGADGGLQSAKGELITSTRPGSMNFGSWWDGDLQRELLDGTVIDKWNYTASIQERILSAHSFGAERNNGTKANPGLSADILGDWREEVIYRHNSNSELLIFTTTIPTTHKFYTFMHDPQYRVSIAWQNVAYNQPPHTSFYVGEGMKTPPTPSIALVENSGPAKPAIYLTARGGDAKAYLGWSTINYNIARLEVYRDTDSNPSGRVRIASLSGSVKSYIDEGLTNGTTYYYWIKGFDENGVIVNSAAAGAKSEGTTLPPPPAIVELEAEGGDRMVDLSWSIENVDIRHIEIFRDTDSNPSGRGRVGIVGADVTSFIDQTVTNNTPYWYWLKVIDVNGKAHGSNAAKATPKPLDGIYTITALHSGMVLDVQKACTGNKGNGNLVQRTAGTTSQQQWQLTSVGDGFYSITNVACGQALGVKAQSVNAEGANILQWDYAASANQQWNFIRLDKKGHYNIVNKHSRQSITVEAGSMADGANVKQWSYAGGENQQFSLTPVNESASTASVKDYWQAQPIEVNVLPNPFSHEFQVVVASKFNYLITNLLGMTVEQGEGENNVYTGSRLKPGVYILLIEAEGVKKQFQLIKE